VNAEKTNGSMPPINNPTNTSGSLNVTKSLPITSNLELYKNPP
jgi:hypothetical protein